MTRFAAALLLAVFPLAAQLPEKPRVRRASVAAIEKSFDGRIERAEGDAFLLLGTTRGVYLEGYGAVFTSEINLINSPGLSPFRPVMSKEEVARVHGRKVRQLAVLKQAMREMLLSTAAALESMPAGEQIVIGVTLFYYSWEDTTGLPSQVVMRATREQLLNRATADGFIHLKEL